jgi:hypothetical protein
VGITGSRSMDEKKRALGKRDCSGSRKMKRPEISKSCGIKSTTGKISEKSKEGVQ